MNLRVDRNRIHRLNKPPLPAGGIILYWMSREQRVDDNWALLHAVELSGGKRMVEIVFTLSSEYSGATQRSFNFCIRGLMETEIRARELGIGFRILTGEGPWEAVRRHSEETGAAAVICDFSPLRMSLYQSQKLAENLAIPVIEVDSRNVVPCRYISPKQEYSAFTLRKKIERVLPEFLVPFPDIEDHIGPISRKAAPPSDRPDWDGILKRFNGECESGEVKTIVPGRIRGTEVMEKFFSRGLDNYDAQRNDPNIDAQSGLSPYLHFGQISAQTAALTAAEIVFIVSLKNSFLDELIVRRELSDNFCLYNPFYDRFEGFPDWAKNSLNSHSGDKREYLYSSRQFEQAETHDRLWNAAQQQLLSTGKIHGYMRMYWAKKILEWSPDASEAMKRTVFLNDKYSLDGHDSNGYAGCAWSIGGIHDRAWQERPVYGKVRYMNSNGCRRKFDVDAYIEKYLESTD